jgi:hypothetical protein
MSAASPPQRDPSKETEIRSVINNEASKILALITGGGAGAVVALLQAVWDKWEPASRDMVITGTWFLLIGLASVPVTLVLRYINGLTVRSYRPFKNWFWYLIMLSYLVTLTLFLTGMGYVISGARLANGP